MRVGDALREIGGSRGVTEPTLRVLVDLGPLVARRLSLQQRLAVDDRLQRRLGNGVGEDHVLLDRREGVGVGFELLDELGIDEEHLVFGVVDGVLEVIVRQSHVAHVHRATEAGGREVQLQVTVVVQSDRSDPTAGLDAQIVQGVREPADSFARIGVGVAVYRAVRPLRDDLSIGKQFLGALEDPVYTEYRRNPTASAVWRTLTSAGRPSCRS